MNTGHSPGPQHGQPSCFTQTQPGMQFHGRQMNGRRATTLDKACMEGNTLRRKADTGALAATLEHWTGILIATSATFR